MEILGQKCFYAWIEWCIINLTVILFCVCIQETSSWSCNRKFVYFQEQLEEPGTKNKTGVKIINHPGCPGFRFPFRLDSAEDESSENFSIGFHPSSEGCEKGEDMDGSRQTYLWGHSVIFFLGLGQHSIKKSVKDVMLRQTGLTPSSVPY